MKPRLTGINLSHQSMKSKVSRPAEPDFFAQVLQEMAEHVVPKERMMFSALRNIETRAAELKK